MNNMYLWELARRPDPDHLKWVDVGRGYTTAEAQYQVEKATAIFGPYGSGWGIDNLKYDIVKDGQDDPVMVILYGELWWEPVYDSVVLSNGKEETRGVTRMTIPGGRFPIVTCKQWAADDDLMKKVMTDLQSKALSKIGIDADLFKGLWGKEGSRKPQINKVVYLGDAPHKDIPPAKEDDMNLLESLIKSTGVDAEATYKALQKHNNNHFAVRTAIEKLKTIAAQKE